MNLFKTKFKLLFLMSLLLFSSCSEKEVPANKIQKRNGIAYEVNNTSPFTGSVVEKYNSGQLKSKIHYIDGKINGVVKRWYKNGQIKQQANFNNGKQEGLTILWANNGQKISETNYIDGIEDTNNVKYVFKASTVFKISKPKKEIAYEIKVIKSRSVREMVAKKIIASLKKYSETNKFSFILDDSRSVRQYKSLANVLSERVKIEQKDGLNIIELSAESPSPEEAALIANTYAEIYLEFNLAKCRKQLTEIREYLEQQKKEKQNELILAKEELKKYQLKGGGVQLNQQALALIQTTTQFEAEKNNAKIEMSMAKESLNRLKQELQKRNGSVTQFESMLSAQPQIELLRTEIAKLQIQKTKALSASSGVNASSLVDKYDKKIANLNNDLKKLIKEQKEKLLASSPDELRQLNQKIFQAQLKYETAKAKYTQLSGIVSSYDRKFNQLPEQTLELARLQRKKMAFEKMYTILEEKYQEALINEQSTPGNVLILSDARQPTKPYKKLYKKD